MFYSCQQDGFQGFHGSYVIWIKMLNSVHIKYMYTNIISLKFFQNLTVMKYFITSRFFTTMNEWSYGAPCWRRHVHSSQLWQKTRPERAQADGETAHEDLCSALVLELCPSAFYKSSHAIHSPTQIGTKQLSFIACCWYMKQCYPQFSPLGSFKN